MSLSTTLDEIHLKLIRSIWLQRFTVFNRLMLAAAFLPSGFTKAVGNRFTTLPVTNPVGIFSTLFIKPASITILSASCSFWPPFCCYFPARQRSARSLLFP